SKEQVIASLRAQGNDKFADMVERLNVVPGLGIDFMLLGELLLLALGLYLVASLFLWLQGYLLNGAVQRSIYRLRSQVEEKINRLPLSYFDKQSRGELLSRVTNDIDNISQSLQQTLSQVLTSVLTVIGVTVMMFVVSPLLALIALVTIPVSIVVVTLIGRRSQKLFIQQWKSTGELNGHIEEAFTGQSLVKVFGRQNEVEAVFAERNNTLYKASFGAQFVSGLIMPTMFFIGNLNYVAIAVVGGLRVASGTMNLGDVQAFIQYTRMFTQPLTQLASLANLLQSGVASAERVFEVLDEEEQVPEEASSLNPTCGRVAFEHIWFSYDAVPTKGDDPLEPPKKTQKPLITDLSLVAEPGSTVAIVGPTGAGRTTLVNLIMRFYELDRGRITLDGVDLASVPRSALRSNTGMERDTAAVQLIEPHDQVDQCGLACPGRPDDGHRASRLGYQGQVGDQRFLGLFRGFKGVVALGGHGIVGEPDVLEGHPTARRIERACLLWHLLLFVEHLEDPLGRGHTGLQKVRQRGQLSQRLGEHPGVLNESLHVA